MPFLLITCLVKLIYKSPGSEPKRVDEDFSHPHSLTRLQIGMEWGNEKGSLDRWKGMSAIVICIAFEKSFAV